MCEGENSSGSTTDGNFETVDIDDRLNIVIV
jgi:hypothetical protein